MSPFFSFMTGEMLKTLSADRDAFLRSMEGSGEKKLKSREKIAELLRGHPEYSARQLAEIIGITEKGVEKQLARLKAEGRLRRDGPDKGGKWRVLD